jgi:hypothetical protein
MCSHDETPKQHLKQPKRKQQTEKPKTTTRDPNKQKTDNKQTTTEKRENKKRIRTTDSNNAYPNTKNKALNEKSQVCNIQGINRPTRNRRKQHQTTTDNTSNTHNKQQTNNEQPTDKQQTTKHLNHEGKGEHSCHAPLPAPLPSGGGGDPSFAVLGTATLQLEC